MTQHAVGLQHSLTNSAHIWKYPDSKGTENYSIELTLKERLEWKNPFFFIKYNLKPSGYDGNKKNFKKEYAEL